ncbi:MAG TPA: SDR family oxidoreductase [Solirubrobacteraceae bacterium]|nr:SDR family oxidoreductase [Solirubrobacteraceae bacterium]
MRILFIGGTGTISSACVRLAHARGIDVSIINRGVSDLRDLPSDVETLVADAQQIEQLSGALAGRSFDVVADFRAFTPAEVQERLDLLRGRVGQYVFISSATVYQKPPALLPIVESTPMFNPDWRYASDKILSEDLLNAAYRDEHYPVTIVRPSHTYDQRTPPVYGGWTQIDRMRRGRPVIVHGDGTSLWTLTHSSDFAVGFLGLLGDPRTLGHAFHITSDEVFTWNQIYEMLATAAGAPQPELVHLPSEAIAKADRAWGDALLGDMAHSLVFDNTKIKRLVPDFTTRTSFAAATREIITWFDADPTRQRVDERFNSVVEALLRG